MMKAAKGKSCKVTGIMAGLTKSITIAKTTLESGNGVGNWKHLILIPNTTLPTGNYTRGVIFSEFTNWSTFPKKYFIIIFSDITVSYAFYTLIRLNVLVYNDH